MRTDQSYQRRSPSVSIEQKDDTKQPLVIIVDDDASVREALAELIQSVGFQSADFASTRELLEAGVLDRPGCIILDVRMPGESGLDLQHHLVQTDNPKPIIFLTGHGDIPMTVQAMKAGAVDFLTKPVRDQTLLDAVMTGINRDLVQRSDALIIKRHIALLETLTQRERQVLPQVARGRFNKQIAFDLGISEVTVKLHRANVMRKMQTASIGELIRIWESLPISVKESE